MGVIASWDNGSLPVVLGGDITLGAYQDVWPLEWINVDHQGQGAARCNFPLSSSSGTVAVRAYVRTPPFWPARTNQFMGLSVNADPAYPQASLAFAGQSNGGQLRVMSDDTVVATSPVKSLLPSRWYRFELVGDFPNLRIRARVAHLHSESPVWDSGWVTSEVPAGSLSEIFYAGAIQGSLLMGHIRLAHIEVVDSASYIGRHSSDAYPWNPPLGDYTQAKILDGGSLVSPEMIGLYDYGGRLIPAVSAKYQAEVEPPPPPIEEVGQVLVSQDFETQTAGSPIVLSSPWEETGAPASQAFVASASAAFSGSLGARMTNSSGWRQITLVRSEDVAGSAVRCYDLMFNIRNLGANIWLLREPDGAATDVRVNADGTVRLRKDNVAISTSAETLSINTWYRMSLRLSAQGQTLRIRDAGSDQLVIEISGPLTVTSWTRMFFGNYAASDGSSFDFDLIRVGDEWLEKP